MGRGKDASKARRLAQMSPDLEETGYEHPRREACEIVEYPIVVAVDERLTVNLWVYRGRTVRFCVELRVRDDGEWVPVTRVDTCHGRVHQHFMSRAGGETTRTLLRLPGNDDERRGR